MHTWTSYVYIEMADLACYCVLIVSKYYIDLIEIHLLLGKTTSCLLPSAWHIRSFAAFEVQACH